MLLIPLNSSPLYLKTLNQMAKRPHLNDNLVNEVVKHNNMALQTGLKS